MDTKKLRQKILDLAIRGKLVPQDPNDEPASLLLERIRAEKERLIKEGKIKRSKKTAENTSENEEPFEVPSDWTICKLEDIAYIGTGATPDTRNKDYYNGNIPWVSSSCTKNDYIDSPTSYISQKAIKETNCQIYPKGTLIMAMYGEGKTRGQVGELRIDAATNQACAAIMPYLISSTQYIKLYLKRSYLNIRQQAEGGLQPNLNLSKIAQYDIPLPPLAEQKRIANEIERWFAVIDELESNEDDLVKAIDKAKSKILDLAIHGKLVPQDPNDEPAIELLKRINPKFNSCDGEDDVPEGWEVASFKTICDTISSKPYQILQSEIKDSGKFPVISQSANYIEGYSDREECVLQVKNPVLIFGDHTRVLKYVDFDFIVGADGVKIIQTKLTPKYVYYVLLCTIHKIQGKGYARHFSILSNTLIPVPPREEQLRIVSKIEEVFKALDALS